MYSFAKRILLLILIALLTVGLQGQTKSDFLMEGRALTERGKALEAAALLSRALESYPDRDV